jgi:hypothetical protein
MGKMVQAFQDKDTADEDKKSGPMLQSLDGGKTLQQFFDRNRLTDEKQYA